MALIIAFAALPAVALLLGILTRMEQVLLCDPVVRGEVPLPLPVVPRVTAVPPPPAIVPRAVIPRAGIPRAGIPIGFIPLPTPAVPSQPSAAAPQPSPVAAPQPAAVLP